MPVPATTSARSVGRNSRPVIDATTASRTEPATNTASTRSDSDATTSAPAIVPGMRPTTAKPTSRGAMCCRSTHAIVNVSGSTASMIAAGMKSGSASSSIGDAIIPSPMPIEACTVAPT